MTEHLQTDTETGTETDVEDLKRQAADMRAPIGTAEPLKG